MVAGRPHLSGIMCLQCEFRLFHTTTQRRLPRFVAPTVFVHGQRPVITWNRRPEVPANHLPRNAPAYFHSGRELYQSQQHSDADIPLTNGNIADEPLDEQITDADAEQIWNSLLEEEGEPTETEVFSYIDELRPADETILSESAFSKSARELAEGFTVAQLLAYIRKYRKPTTQPTVYPWEVRRRPWVPDVYGDEAVVDSKIKAIGPGSSLLLKGYIQTSMTNKERVVVQLMRECWGVSKREVMEAPGRLDVTVQELEFALLTAGAQTWLRDISTAYSTITTTTATTSRSSSRSHSRSQTRHHRHIELLPGRQKLRIFAPASTADAILAEIHGMLCQATTKRFPLADVARQDAVITPAVLRAVGALTGSWVRLLRNEQAKDDSGTSSSEVLVSWVAAADRNIDLEDTGDLVYRLLLRAFGPTSLPAAHATSVLDYTPLKRSKARFLAETDESSRETWPWEQRQGKWARLIEPAPLDASTARQRAAQTTTTPSEDALPMAFTGLTASTIDNQPNPQWYQASRTSTVATFGRVLHAQSMHHAGLLFGVEGATSDVAPPLPDLARILSPTVPPLLGLSSLADRGPAPATEEDTAAAPPSLATTSTTITLRFLPDPKTALAGRAPLLEVFLDAVPGQQPVFSQLHVVTATNTSDVLFPTQPVDVRITQKQFFALPGADMLPTADAESNNTGLEPLVRFLDKSQLQLDGGQPGAAVLATPLCLEGLPLPADVLLPADVSNTGGAQQHGQVTVDYVFAGLEVRRRVATAFEGWTAALTSVEAGRGDGRWTELNLEAIPASSVSGLPSAGDASFDASKASFRQAVGHMVHGDRVQWLMRHRQVV
ncbi:uncharacterized protein SPSK_05964 [Sporothrix schenckii 1099-18]|uniref:Uncharacterized protein n=1 Tax=Sporothrix schenckii 1099-18 TaxID=1397361 RepID=A0A0F2MKY6_SPOSC|nr:uncharacterized protein SPSK_05964 [Sporothrix schenckii 1099-18]KJR89724.1 hypothetical protein SPSK_05964 [Sporothrix schenckii 1099-18]